ncbi:MAG: DUF6288 domain-containing protein [Verrucomicrobia bacterium]|nr:DUF6288 domain-containing protein [Verrucomicrobiota bacterium]
MKISIVRSSALLALGVFLQVAGPVRAAVPDATKDYIDATFTYNLGPTGTRGWIYSTGNEWMFVPEGLTSESRQIKITAVEKGSPADGILLVDDVILGIGAGEFTEDARKSLGVAIGEAETAENKGHLKLKIWRMGTLHDNVTLPLAVMGAYSATAPYDCPKSARILTNACKYLETHATFNAGNEGNAVVGLALLAAGRPADLPKVQAYARKVAAGVGKLTVPLNEMCAWPWGYNNTFLCEYYLTTGDQEVLHAISEYTITSARGQSWCGTYGHGMAWPKPDGSSTHGIVPPYGALNQAGLLVSIGIVLGDKCGIKDPEIAPAIERSRRYFGYFAGKGAVPYGESPAEELHDDNGKNGEAALLLALQSQADMSPQVQYFAKSCTAAYALREFGHCGPYWAKLWQPMAVNLAGPEAMAAYFKKIAWELDLTRRWDGSFVYHGSTGGKPNDEGSLGPCSNTGAFMLTYAMPLRKIHLTGKIQDPKHRITSKDVQEAITDGVCSLRNDLKAADASQLVNALSSWSAQKRGWAAQELAGRTHEVAALVPKLMEMAEATDVNTRMGATKVLTLIQDERALPVLVRRLNDSDYYVRWLAAGGYSGAATMLWKPAARPALTDMLKTIVSHDLPVEPINWDEPCQAAQTYLAQAVFNGQLKDSVAGVPTGELYPAIATMSRAHEFGRAALAGFVSGNALQPADINALAPLLTQTLMEAYDYPDFRLPNAIVSLLSKHNYEEGIAAAMLFPKVVLNRSRLDANTCMEALQRYRSAARSTLPALEYWNTHCLPPPVEGLSNGQLTPTIATIENDKHPPPKLNYFKTIESASVAPEVFTKPVVTTRLKASATSIAGNPLIYTWSKVRGAGPVTFSPNGTSASSNSTATFAIPGTYVLRLTVSDALLGDTAGYGGVSTDLTVKFKDGKNVANRPPVATPQSVTLAEDTSKALKLTGTDPEGYTLDYSLTGLPAHGTLSGTAPNLTYTPPLYFKGADSFTFTVTDSEGQASPPATVSLTVTHVNHPPVAHYRSQPVAVNTPAEIELTASDIDQDPLTYAVLTRPAHGTLAGTAPKFKYTPAAGYQGRDGFTFRVSDGKLDSEPATITFNMGGLAVGIFSEFYQWPDLSNPEPWPDMASRKPDTTRIDAKMQIAAAEFPPNYEDHFCSRHTGYLKIETAGDYQFSISADDHAKLWVDGKLAIEQYYSKKGWNAGALPLTPGYHEFKLEYMESYGGNYVTLSWSGPGVSGAVPPAACFHLTSDR